MDRTEELFALAAELHPSASATQKLPPIITLKDKCGQHPGNAATETPSMSRSEFLKQATALSREIKVAAAKLSRLAQRKYFSTHLSLSPSIFVLSTSQYWMLDLLFLV